MAHLSTSANHALEKFQVLETTELGYKTGHSRVRDGYSRQVHRARKAALESLGESKVLSLLGSVAWEHQDAPEADRQRQPLYRLASYFVSRPSLASGLEHDQSAEDWTARIAGGVMVSRDLDEVAFALSGRQIRSAAHTGTIDIVRAQDSDHNGKFAGRPVFGVDRADVYISGMRGHHLMYLRADVAEALCCVALLDATIDGEPAHGPNAVGVALEMPREHIADVLMDGDYLVLDSVRPRP